MEKYQSTETINWDSPLMEFLPLLISISTWLTPSPVHAKGLLVNYGNQQIVEANALYRGYDLSFYPNRCGGSAISPADLGKVFYVKLPNGEWYGACLFVDVGARVDFANQISIGEVAELPDWMLAKFDKYFSAEGEIYIGSCPNKYSIPQYYKPVITYSNEPHPYIPYPKQQRPPICGESKCDRETR
jgi:hypothetical protein